MLTAPCYIVSDTHLGAAPSDVERRFVAFLHAIADRAGSLVINGDLFDFWFEWKTVIPRGSYRVLAAIAALHERGIPVLWIAGNHDCWGGDMLRKDVGVDYHVGPWTGELAGWKTRIEHGDGLRDREDRGYRALRRVLRNPWAIRLYRRLHPDFATRLAMGSSHASRTYRAADEGRGLRDIAMQQLAADPALELVLFGHSHVATLERASTGGVYANAGSWLDAPTFLRITRERAELMQWDGSAEGKRLNAIDRRAEKALA